MLPIWVIGPSYFGGNKMCLREVPGHPVGTSRVPFATQRRRLRYGGMYKLTDYCSSKHAAVGFHEALR